MALSDVKVLKVTTALAQPLSGFATPEDLAGKADKTEVDATIGALQANIEEEGDLRFAGDQAESAARAAAVSALSDNITQEGTIRAVGDATNEANLTFITRYAAGFGQGDLVEVYDSLGGAARQWLATFEAGKSGYLNGLELAVADVGANPARVQITVLKAPINVGNAQVTDVSAWAQLAVFNEAASSLGVSAGASSTFRMWFRDAVRVSKGDRLGFLVRIYTAGDAPVTFGMGNGRLQSGSPDFFKGGYSNAIGNTVGAITSTFFVFARPLIRAARTNPRARGQIGIASRNEAGEIGTVGFTRVAFNTLVTQASRFDGLVAKLGEASGVSAFEVLAVRRPGTVRGSAYDPANSSYVIGSDPADEILFRHRVAARDILQGRYGALVQTVTFPFPFAVEINAGELLLVQITALAADRVNLATMRVWPASSFTPQSLVLERGSYSTATSGAAMQAIGDQTLSFKLLGEQIDRPRAKRLADVPVLNAAMPATAPGLTLALPSITVDAYDNPRAIPAQTLTFDSVGAAEAITAYSDMLRFGDITPLRARRHASVTVIRQSDGATLVEGTDYYRDPNYGYIRGLVNTASFAITITENAYRMRVDTVLCAPAGESLQILKGTPRFSDPDNWQREPTESTVSAGRVEVCRVLVTNNGLEVLDRTEAVPGGLSYADDDDYLRMIRKHNAAIVRPFLAEAGRGSAANITALFYGDSRTAQGDGIEPEWQTVPGGPTRDRRDFFTLQQPDDCFTNPACPAYTPLINGPAGTAKHVRASLHWRALAIINAAFGCTITGKNLGIGGTTSGTGEVNGRKNGSNPDRLAGLTAAKGTGLNICLIAFGTNDADTDDLTANIAAIVRYCRANGIIPIVIGQPDVSPARAIDWHRRQEVRIMRGAMSAGAAFVPLSIMQFERANRGILFPTLASGAGGFNHEGLWFDLQAGRWVAEFLLSC